ncbi:hypothetical protein [Marinicrinis lubricantis]|uniref:DUF2759 family protein n=1 Tax=Marinicrinis lubricantis TaxID=2086470 RepID=A0ABW1IT58_9BACL
MFLAAEAAETAEKAGKFTPWDIFMVLFTIIIAIAVVRNVTAKEKNLFAVGFSIVALLAFLYVDYLMVRTWLGIL